jgi:hypothetical protein
MSQSSSPFSKYVEGDLPELIKLAEGESFIAKYTGLREQEFDRVTANGAKVTDVIPVLDLEDLRTGEPKSWRAGPWRARKALAGANPSVGDVIEVRRVADIGMSHDFLVRVVPEGELSDEIPF